MQKKKKSCISGTITQVILHKPHLESGYFKSYVSTHSAQLWLLEWLNLFSPPCVSTLFVQLVDNIPFISENNTSSGKKKNLKALKTMS